MLPLGSLSARDKEREVGTMLPAAASCSSPSYVWC